MMAKCNAWKITSKGLCVAALSATILSSGCGGSGGGSSSDGGSIISAEPSCAAVFANDAFVDYNVQRPEAPEASEAYNIEMILTDAGLTVTTFTGYTATDFTTAVSGCAGPVSTLVIPELEQGDLAASLDAAAQTAIADFVQGGGNLVVSITWNNNRATDLINGIFDWSTNKIAEATPIELYANDAAGTPFEGGTIAGGTSLPNPSATDAVETASLPAVSRVIYADANGNAAVAMIQVGAGTVTLLGWDYYDAAPVGTVDDGWNEVLVQAATNVGLEQQIPLTNVALADVEDKGWSTCFTALYNDEDTLVADALEACGGTEMMVACRQVGSDTLTVGAWANKDQITVDTGINTDVTNDIGGVSWYFSDSHSWGFSSRGTGVNKVQCDMDTMEGEQRLCWHTYTGDGTFDGGWRCGTETWLNDSTAWERVLLQR